MNSSVQICSLTHWRRPTTQLPVLKMLLRTLGLQSVDIAAESLSATLLGTELCSARDHLTEVSQLLRLP